MGDACMCFGIIGSLLVFFLMCPLLSNSGTGSFPLDGYIILSMILGLGRVEPYKEW